MISAMSVLLWLASVYIAVVWVGLRLAVPNLGFRTSPLPDAVPPELTEAIARLDAEAADNADYLRKAYAYITARYQGSRLKTFTRFWVAFLDPLRLRPGYAPCTTQNYLLRLLLVRSGRFSEGDMEVRVVLLNGFIHQYLRVHVNGAWVDADPWSASLGVPLGGRSAYFG